ncbi:MAG: gamma-glutamyl-gamma-aminobutyrate hydrolase family protein [Alphaproteobacteria bacterium]|nr:gamma-glutamyl-gamma-aminobutyrate hydrolase family protein [Alphaproteobacteria bacterium]
MTGAMRIGILEAGRPAPDLAAKHGDYRRMFRDLLGPALPEAEFVDYAAIDGHLPTRPDAADAWLVTGSAYSVYDPDPWIGALKRFVREAVNRGVPVFGICFGHQLIAEVMGGKVEKAAQGWGVGVHRYAVAEAADWMVGAEAGAELATLVSHQDQVVRPPPGARLLAASAFCPYAMLEIGPKLATLQSHPEMPAAYCADLYESRRERIGGARVDAAIASLSDEIHAARAAEWIAAFYRRALAA